MLKSESELKVVPLGINSNNITSLLPKYSSHHFYRSACFLSCVTLLIFFVYLDHNNESTFHLLSLSLGTNFHLFLFLIGTHIAQSCQVTALSYIYYHGSSESFHSDFSNSCNVSIHPVGHILIHSSSSSSSSSRPVTEGTDTNVSFYFLSRIAIQPTDLFPFCAYIKSNLFIHIH